jgi:hypothetical protein
MSVSLQQLPSKSSYFYTDNGNLYYVLEILDEDYLVEDCKTLLMMWVTQSSLEALDWHPCGGFSQGARA